MSVHFVLRLVCEAVFYPYLVSNFRHFLCMFVNFFIDIKMFVTCVYYTDSKFFKATFCDKRFSRHVVTNSILEPERVLEQYLHKEALVFFIDNG